jgi:hypothetical protein
LERAKQEADRVLLGLSERRETLVQHLQDMQTRLVGVAKELEVAIEEPEGADRSRSDVAEEPDPAEEPAAPGSSVPMNAPEGTEHRVDPQDTDEDHHPAGDGLDGLEGMLDDGIDMPGIPPLELDFDEDPDD